MAKYDYWKVLGVGKSQGAGLTLVAMPDNILVPRSVLFFRTQQGVLIEDGFLTCVLKFVNMSTRHPAWLHASRGFCLEGSF